MQIGLVALDLAGASPDDLRLSQADQSALRSAAGAGVRLVLVSAQTADVPARIRDALGIRALLIAERGAHIVDEDNTDVLHARIDPAVARRILSAATARPLFVIMRLGDVIYARAGPAKWWERRVGRLPASSWSATSKSTSLKARR